MSHWNEIANQHRPERVIVSPEAIKRAAAVLAAGGLVAFPTETVYGLGADATRGETVAKIYEAKARPQFNPLIAHVPDLAAARQQGVFNAEALQLAQAFWPGPLTLVVPAAETCSVSDLARAGLPSLALRVPAHPVARALLEAFGRPVAAPSANRSGRISPTTADHVMEELQGRCDLVLDGGAAEVGLESTIVDCTGPEPFLLRPGGITREALEEQLGRPLAFQLKGSAVIAPGMLESHYAPDASVRLNAVDVEQGEAVLDFAGQLFAVRRQAKAYAELSRSGDLQEAAGNLFAALRKLDASGAQRIAVAPVPPTGLGEAITDRLSRAAAPRS